MWSKLSSRSYPSKLSGRNYSVEVIWSKSSGRSCLVEVIRLKLFGQSYPVEVIWSKWSDQSYPIKIIRSKLSGQCYLVNVIRSKLFGQNYSVNVIWSTLSSQRYPVKVYCTPCVDSRSISTYVSESAVIRPFNLECCTSVLPFFPSVESFVHSQEVKASFFGRDKVNSIILYENAPPLYFSVSWRR